jgi:hypothetical protein
MSKIGWCIIFIDVLVSEDGKEVKVVFNDEEKMRRGPTLLMCCGENCK